MLMCKYKVSAVVVLVLAASSCSTSPKQYVDKGNGLFTSGLYADAELNYQKAIQKDPGYGEAYYRLGISQLQGGKLAESLQTLTRAFELLPNRDDVQVAL